jgi:hypothetical protein
MALVGGSRRGAGRPRAPATPGEAAARLRKLTAEAGIAELELERMRLDLVSTARVRAANASALAIIRSRLLGLGARLGAQLSLETDAAKCAALVAGAVHEALTELSDAFGVKDA